MDTEAVKILNHIVKLLHDGYSCYKKHIENVQDPSLKRLFARLGEQCHVMREEIKQQMQLLGAQPEEGGTVMETLHEFYENFKNLITQGDPLAITKEIKRGENMLVEQYKEAFKRNLPESMKNILLKQLNQVEDVLKACDMQVVNAVSAA